MHLCPHCGGPAITGARKLALVPGARANCRCCGEKICVPHLAVLAWIPLIAALLVLRVVDSGLARVLALVAGVGVICYIQWRHVPLIRA